VYNQKDIRKFQQQPQCIERLRDKATGVYTSQAAAAAAAAAALE